MDAELLGFRVISSAATASPRPLGALRSALREAVPRGPAEARPDVQLLTSVLPELLGDEQERGNAAPAERLRVAWTAEATV